MPAENHPSQNWSRPLRQFSFAMVLAAFLAALSFTTAFAQLSIQIGGSEAEYKATLARSGYDRIDTVKIGLSNSSFNACKDGKRYRIKFEWTGQTTTKVIGECRTLLSQEQIADMLAKKGYNRISIEDISGNYLAIVCLSQVRYRVEVNYYGDITGERRIGKCFNELSPSDITAKLEAEGYDRINFINRQPPVYTAVACKDFAMLELKIDVFGIIRESRNIDRCRGGINPDEIVQLLEDRGLTQVVLIDGLPPRYMAEACRDNYRVQVTLNRWGGISDEIRIGDCRSAFTIEQVKASMRSNGYRNVSVTTSGDRFITKGCRENRYNEIILSQYGELVSHRDLGSCDAPKINDLAELLRSRGMDDLVFFVEGCENKSKIRLTFDEFANRTNRQIIGGC